MNSLAERGMEEELLSLFNEIADLESSEREAVLEQLKRDKPTLGVALRSLLRTYDKTTQTLRFDLQEQAAKYIEEENFEGQMFGVYHLERRLGAGGMGTVYLARAENHEGRVAIKVVLSSLPSKTRERFKEEMQNLASCESPHIAQIRNGDITPEGVEYFAMEYVEGLQIDVYCQNARLQLNARLALFLQLCDAVRAAHKANVVHRDLKPSNVLVNKDGQVKLVDFGIAERLGGPKNKPAEFISLVYAPPEYARRPADVQGDVYSLGILLCELITGLRPVDMVDKQPSEIEEAIRSGILTPPSQLAMRPEQTYTELADLPKTRMKELDYICGKAWALDPNDRYETVAALSHDIQCYLQLRPLVGLSQNRLYRASRFYRRLQPVINTACAIVFVILAVVAYYTYRVRQRERESAAINAFLTEDLLRESNPDFGKGIGETLNQAIENVRPRIEARFGGQPRVAAGVHEEIAKALSNEVDVEGGGAEFDAAARDWRKAEGPKSERAVLAELQHALLELKSQQSSSIENARVLLDQEAPVIATLGHPSSQVRSSQLSAEGMMALMRGDLKAAEGSFQDAVKISGTGTDVPIEQRLSLQARLCYIQTHVGKAEQAVKCFRSLLPQYEELYGKASGRVVNLQINLAQALMLNNEFRESIEQVNRVYPDAVRTLGPENQITQSLLAMKAQAEAGLQQWDQAIADTLTIAETARKLDPKGFLGVMGYADAALLECGEHRIRDGEEHARYALSVASSAGQAAGTLGHADYSVAFCILASEDPKTLTATRLKEAERLLDAINVPAAEATAGEPGWVANVDLARAQLAFYRKQYCTAMKYLASAKPAFDPADADQRQREAVVKLSQQLASTRCD